MELSDEEIKAIEKVKEAIRVDKEQRIVTIYDEKPLFRDQLQIILDLLNKQQEKIADLETKLAIETIDNKYIQEERDEETIPRYKIREKIKEYREETMRCQECKDYEDANINQRILLAFDKLLEE